MNTFENLQVWQKSKILYVKVFTTFKNCKEYYFKDQICRASLSIVNNIAEGYERQTSKELRQFLFIAKGSSGEVRSMLLIAIELYLVPEEKGNQLVAKANEISKMLSGFIKSLNT